MNGIRSKIVLFIGMMVCLWACKGSDGDKLVDALPPMYPDYPNVTLPLNIAPLNFLLRTSTERVEVRLRGKSGESTFIGSNGKIQFPEKEWHALLQRECGGKIEVSVRAQQGDEWLRYKAFTWQIVPEQLDTYIVYRQISPEGENRHVELCEREVGNFHERKIMQEETDGVMPHLSVNTLYNMTDARSNNVVVLWMPERAMTTSSDCLWEYFGTQSRLCAINRENGQSRILADTLSGQTVRAFPALSADGRSLYYSEAPAAVRDSLDAWCFSIYHRKFNSQNLTWADAVDTVYYSDTVKVSVVELSLSPDGQYLLFATTAYGLPSSGHRDSDLRMLHLNSGRLDSLEFVNTEAAEGQPSWTSDSHWFVFMSKKGDGLYGKPYFCYVDSAGVAHKPFMLPQRDPARYDYMLESLENPMMVSRPMESDAFRKTNEIINENTEP